MEESKANECILRFQLQLFNFLTNEVGLSLSTTNSSTHICKHGLLENNYHSTIVRYIQSTGLVGCEIVQY